MTDVQMTPAIRGSEPDSDSEEVVSAPRRGSRLLGFLKQLALPAAFGLVVLVAWEVLVRVDVLDPIIFPAPTSILSRWGELAQEPFYWEAVRITSVEAALGFFLGSFTGFAIGALCTIFTSVRQTIYPWVIGFQNTPKIALAPVFATWFGFGMTSKVVLAATICFFPLVISTIVGLDAVDRDNRLIFRSFGASRTQMFWKLVVPSALPVIFSAVKHALTLAVIGAVVAEFVSGSQGLGVLVKDFNFRLDIAAAFAMIASLGLLGLVMYGAVAYADKKIVFWRDTSN
ncbi:ABC transporter permease [Euzebya tangerina]|uniref:ABC transporter permease n=1 Tax=Euzebya tangerina TaxID=591198 RepID=UPI000E3177D7|nr:ABC transporter permease [Euzebya tangerina]